MNAAKKKILSKEREKDLEYIQNFRLLDDDFMSKCFENNIECTEFVLHIILNKHDLKVQKVNTQYSIKNLQGRSVRLDIYALDASGRTYNIEIQRADKGAGAQRARFNSSIIDANILPVGEDFSLLPETYIIFITENDVIGDNLPIYHIDRVISETGKYFDDGSHIIYVNANYKDDTPLGILMHDFSCTNPYEMKYPILAERVKYFKKDEEGISIMCKAMEEMRNEAAYKAAYKAAYEVNIKNAIRMLKIGKLSIEEITEITELPIDVIKSLSEIKE